MISAITFDLWDTLLVDDSDEPLRAARGQRPKAEARRVLFVDAVRAHHPVTPEDAQAAWEHAWQWFEHRWKVDWFTHTVRERVEWALTRLKLPLLPGLDDLVRALQTMERDVPPLLVEGCAPVIRALAADYRLGIISDTTTTPGWVLRELLEGHGLMACFDHCVFSDEVGHAKPSTEVFELAACGLGATLDQMVHIGDREAHDIDGALSAGVRAILFTGVVDRRSGNTRAHAVCASLASLPALLETFDQ